MLGHKIATIKSTSGAFNFIYTFSLSLERRRQDVLPTVKIVMHLNCILETKLNPPLKRSIVMFINAVLKAITPISNLKSAANWANIGRKKCVHLFIL